MTRNSRSNSKKKAIAAALTTLFLSHQVVFIPAIASEISGVTGVNGTYNIDPAGMIGDSTGYRQYENFNLSEGDIANLIYQYGGKDINTFLNLVDNKITIDGILNTMKNGNFYNGKAVFISPKGMVVGASGVLNVGSLGVYTPTNNIYQQLKDNPTAANLATAENTPNNGGAPITINGKVFAADDVELRGGKITVANGAGVFAGVNDSEIANVVSAKVAASQLFDQLVNANNIKTGNTFASDHGSISIMSDQEAIAGGVNIAGTVRNFGTGNTEIYNNTNGGMEISGTVGNIDGTLAIHSDQSGLNITKTANIKNVGKTTIANAPIHQENASKTLDGVTYDYTRDTNSGLTIAGNIDTAGTLNIVNYGDQGLNISGTVGNVGTINITNGTTMNTQTSDSHVSGSASTADEINARMAALNITGTINNEGDLNIDNKAAGGLNTAAGATIYNEGTSTVLNEAGAMTIGGTFTNIGNATFTNQGTSFGITGNVNNSNGLLDMTNNGTGAFTTEEGSTINAEGLNMTNNGSAFAINGNVKNAGNGNFINNKGSFSTGANSNIQNTQDTANFKNNGTGDMTFGGTVNNTGDTNVVNSDVSGKLTLGGSFTNNTGTTKMVNNGTGFDVTGTVTNKGDLLSMENNGGAFTVTQTGNIVSSNRLKMVNNGDGGFAINGNVANTGTTEITNNAADLDIGGTIDNNGDTEITNNGVNLKVNDNGTVKNKNGKLSILNSGKNGGLYVYGKGKVSSNGYTEITNEGKDGLNIEGTVENSNDLLAITNNGTAGLNISGNVYSKDNAQLTNTGVKGVNIASTGSVNGDSDIIINNTPAGATSKTESAVKVMGLVNAKGNVKVNSTNGNVTIGDNTTNDNYITAGKDINIAVVDANILNYGVEKTLLNAAGDLTMTATNGTIGAPVQQNACTGSGCTGIGPKADGSRDFTKSINAKVKGKVNATTSDVAKSGDDLVINYAAIDSDMNIDAIKADGRVILTVDDDYGNDNNGTRYNMVNANTTGGTNVEGWGMSLISNGSIGSKDNMLTFIQTDAANHKIDALANENIYIKENSYNDPAYGRDKEITENSACTMIAREGDLYAEFAGNTKIDNVTAEGDLTIITRGKTLEIENLGHINDSSVTPADYFGKRHDGYAFDGRYDKDDYKSEVLPNNVTLKALDINHNIRETKANIENPQAGEGLYEAYAGSTVKVKNAVIDNGTMNITADTIYANGVKAEFKDNFTKVADSSTSTVVGVQDEASLGIPVGNAVRPDDVSSIGRNEHERNYYYPEGDGDIKIGNSNTTVDDDDNIADRTPLDFDVIPDNPITPPGPPTPPPTPTPDPEPDPTPVPDPTPDITTEESFNNDGDGSLTWKKEDDNDVEAIDKRQYMRFNVANNANPVLMEKTDNGIDELLDVSRGGIAVTHSNRLKVGDVVPVHLKYADLDIKADVKVVTATTNRAGAQFINLNKATANKLLYLSLILEENTISYKK